MEGNEEKAIALYMSKDGSRVPLDQAFPTKKSETVDDTPIHLAAKFALTQLLHLFLEYGGNPAVVNSRKETALHSTCLLASFPLKRAELMEVILQWEYLRQDNVMEKIDVNAVDVDGNTALHLTSYNGMVQCIEVLIKRGAKLSIINKSNLSCCECADRGNFRPVGTMLELAWLFQPTNELQLATQVYNKFSNENSGGSIILDSRSIALTGLIDFINHAIRITAESLGETAARAEVLLTQYCWDVKRLKKEFISNYEKVLKATKLKPRFTGTGKKFSPADKDTDTIRVGLAVEDVYCDPCYLKVPTFTIYKDGSKKSYSLQNYDGKVCVFPTGFDPSLRYMDDFGASNTQNTGPSSGGTAANNTANVKPKRTEPCSMCGEMMLEACSIVHFISGNIVEPFKREIRCSSGHKFCFNCWSDHAQSHHTLGCIPCPSVDCGEILDLQWAPMVLKRSELVNRLLTNRQQNVIKSLELKLCPAPNCGLLVRVLPHSAAKMNRAAGCSRVAICANGHAFCVNCCHEAHSPLQCSELTIWQELLRQESKTATLPKDKIAAKSAGASAKQPQSLFVSPPTSKRCPTCDSIINKNEACNFVTCIACHKKMCWICMRDWNTHIEGNTMLYCNQFVEKIPKSSVSNMNLRDNGEEKTDEPALIQKRQKNQRQNKILHHFIHYMSHMQSQKLEHDSRRHTLARILEGLRASQEGELVWLRGTTSANPLFERVEDDHLPTIGYKEDALIADYQLPVEECVEFVSEGFSELEKSRTLLKWSYPFALFEFDDKIIKNKKSPNYTPQRLESFRIDFYFVQANLEYNTEILSNFLARKRIRGTKQEITMATLTLRTKRIQFEQLLQDYLTPPSLDDVTITPSEEAKRVEGMVPVSTYNMMQVKDTQKNTMYRGGSNLSFFINNPVLPNGAENNNEIILPQQYSASSLPTAGQQHYQQPQQQLLSNGNPSFPMSMNPNANLRNGMKLPDMIPEPVEVLNIEQRIIGPKKDPDQEALEHAILLSKQEEEFGLNMYDSVTPADEPLIAEYMEQGFTREESILIIYEEKFGKVSIQSKDITPSLPTTLKSGGYHPLQDDPEVKKLMARGYTKEQAIEIAAKRTVKRQTPQRLMVPPSASVLPNANVTEDEAIRSLVACGYSREQAIAMYHETRKEPRISPVRDDSYHRADLLAANEINNTETAISAWIARGYTREQAIHQVLMERQRSPQGGGHFPIPQISPAGQYNRALNQSQDTAETGFDAQVAGVFHNHSIYRASAGPESHYGMVDPTNSHHRQMATSPNRNGGNSANNSAIYPSIPAGQSIFRAGGGANLSGYSPAGMQNEANYSGSIFETSNVGEFVTNPRTYDMNTFGSSPNRHQHNQRSRPADAMMMEKSMLLLQQESEFGINMFDSLTPADEPEINALIAQGYTNDDAAKMIFDRRYRPYDPKLQPMSTNQQTFYPSEYQTENHSVQYGNESGYQENKINSFTKSPTSAHYPSSYGDSRQVHRGNNSRSGDYEQPDESNTSYYSRNMGRGPDMDMMPPSSRQQQRGYPQEPSVSTMSRSTSRFNNRGQYKESDIKQLERMGFSREQASQALLESNNDVRRAADVLLSSR
jgi:Holliday junction resolvasome RuvABC DNA-binding subunit